MPFSLYFHHLNYSFDLLWNYCLVTVLNTLLVLWLWVIDPTLMKILSGKKKSTFTSSANSSLLFHRHLSFCSFIGFFHSVILSFSQIMNFIFWTRGQQNWINHYYCFVTQYHHCSLKKKNEIFLCVCFKIFLSVLIM